MVALGVTSSSGRGPTHLTWSMTDHLASMLDDIDRLAAEVASAVDLGSTAPDLWDASVIASCRLDGAAMTSTPASGDVTSLVTKEMPVEEVWRREYAGVQMALQSDDLAELLRRDVLRGIQALHRMLTVGLVARDSAGRLRRSEQAVHDGNEGRIVFSPVASEHLAEQLPSLQTIAADRDLHPVVVAGLLQFELLRLHPFESANGRLARTAARLVLREAGLDPGGLSVAEIPMARRPVGNYDDVAGTLRSGDVTRMLEGWAEDVVTGLRLAAAALGLEPSIGSRGDVLDELSPAFTLIDLRDAMGDLTNQDACDGGGSGDSVAAARHRVSLLLDAGLADMVPRSRGLRFTRRPPQPDQSPSRRTT